MTLAHHDTTHRDERRSGETHLFGAEQCSDHHVAAGFEPAIGLQHHAAAKVVEHQSLVRLGNAQLPRQPSVFDARQGRCASAARFAGDQNMIGLGLGHTRGDGAHAHFGHELYADARGAVGVLEVVDQLRQILNGIDIVMRRRTNQAHAGRAVADARNGFIHLASGQLAALTGLRALGNFDLQFVGVREVPDGHPKPARGNLLDRRALGITVGQWIKPLRIFAAFAGITLAAQTVHRNREALVCLGRDGAEAHRTGAETLHDLAGRLHFLNRDRAAIHAVLELHQPTQRAARLGIVVNVIGKLFVGIKIVRARCGLERSDGIRIPHVLLALGAPVKFTRVGQRFHLVLLAGWKTQRVATQHFLRQFIKVYTLHATGRAHKAQVNHLILQANRLKDLRALVGMERGDTHFGHHLEHTLGHALTIGRHERGVIAKFLRITQTLTARLPQRLKRHVGIDRVSAVSHEQTVMMHLTGFAGFQHQPDLRAQSVFHEIMMHRTRGHQRAHRHAIGRHRTIAKDREAVAILDRLLGLGANAIKRLAHTGNAGFFREGDVDLLRAPAPIIHALERVELFVGQNRMRHTQALRVTFGGLEQILFRTDVTLERHDDLLANRIDCGIGHLSKKLAEIIVDHPRLVAETSKCGVVTHRAKRIALLMHEW